VEPIAPLITEEMLAGLDRFWRTRTRVELEKLGPDAAARALPYIQEWAAAAAGTRLPAALTDVVWQV